MSKNIPIKAAKEVSEKYKKDQVVIISYKKEPSHLTTVTTYGKTTIDCDQACQLGNIIKERILKWPFLECMAEPHRVKKLKSEVKELKLELKKIELENEKTKSEME